MNYTKKVLVTKKVGMTSLINTDGKVEAVTVLSVCDHAILTKKSIEKDGYVATLVGYNITKSVNKPMQGIFKKYNSDFFTNIFEIKGVDLDELDISLFQEDEQVKLRSKSKGKGFQGTIKRHGFRRGPKTHGSKSYRIPGSIGQCSTPSKVMKGKKMAGQTGSEFISSKTKIIKIDSEKKLIFIKGSVAGALNSEVFISGN